MSEKSKLKKIGARPQKNSGRGKHKKGDGIKGQFLIDVKEYEKSYSVSISNWAKISSDAWTAGNLIPAVNLELGTPGEQVGIIMFPRDVGIELMELYNEKYA